MSFKDAGTTQYKASASSVANNVTTTTKIAGTITVNKANTVRLQFVSGAPSVFKEGAYDPWDYVEVGYVDATTPTGFGQTARAARAAKNTAAAAAVKADQESLLAYFKSAYDIVETSADKYDATQRTWTITAKEGVEPDETLIANYEGATLASTVTKNVTVNPADPEVDPTDPKAASEVEFVNTPTAKSYKVKALKKKAKSFTVKAEADNGAVVNYKLINAPAKIVIDKTSGKITLKKKLAKGTYKIKVKAYVKGNSAVSETHAITIKVKK